MDIKSTYRGPKLLTKPEIVEDAYELSQSGFVNIYSNNQITTQSKKPKDEKSKLKDLSEVFSAGEVSAAVSAVKAVSAESVRSTSLEMYQLGNTTSKTELVDFFLKNNFAPDTADKLTDNVLGIVKSVPGKAVFIGLAGGATVYGLLEVVKPSWGFEKKLFWSAIVAVLVSLFYFVLVQFGIMK